MQNVRQLLIDNMRSRLTAATAHTPGSVAMAVPLGTCADAAMEILSGGMTIPTIPAYRPEIAAERRWYGAITTDDLDNGAQYPVLSVVRDGDRVVVTMECGDAVVRATLPESDAADFGLSVVSAAYTESQPAPSEIVAVTTEVQP